MALFDGLQAEILTKVLRNHMKKNGITLICVTDNGEKLEFKQFSTDQIILEKSKVEEFLKNKPQEIQNEH
jgi:hypothetical protein